MHETPADLAELQQLLDTSYASAGRHLRSIIQPELRVDAAALTDRLHGVQLLHLATVTAACEPRVAPVDGLFFRGRFWFGSAQDSARFRHIRARPQVSATVTHGEAFQVTVHGTAQEADLFQPQHGPFREYLIQTYGDSWNEWGASAPYACIQAKKMFTYSNPHGVPPASDAS